MSLLRINRWGWGPLSRKTLALRVVCNSLNVLEERLDAFNEEDIEFFLFTFLLLEIINDRHLIIVAEEVVDVTIRLYFHVEAPEKKSKSEVKIAI